MATPRKVIDSVNLRLARAEKHLKELERLVEKYRASDPYGVAETFERRRQEYVYRVVCIKEPDDQIAVVVGDVMHNVRSALNYLMVGLVPSDRRRRAQFPIFGDPDPFARIRPGGSYLERKPDRRLSWRRYVEGVHPDALALIKEFQPYQTAWNNMPTYLGWLSAVNNADKHSQLAAITSGARQFRHVVPGIVPFGVVLAGDPMFDDGTEIFRHKTQVEVQISYTAEVAVKTGQVNIPTDELRNLLKIVRHDIVTPLQPFLRR